MANVIKQPCDEGVIQSGEAKSPCCPNARPWVLAATILGSSMVFIDETAVTVAPPAVQGALGATAIDAQWIVEAYTLLLAALILVGGSLGDHLGRRRVFAIGIGLRRGIDVVRLRFEPRAADRVQSDPRGGRSPSGTKLFGAHQCLLRRGTAW